MMIIFVLSLSKLQQFISLIFPIFDPAMLILPCLLLIDVVDPDWIRIQGGPWIRIQIQEGKNYPEKFKQLINFIF